MGYRLLLTLVLIISYFLFLHIYDEKFVLFRTAAYDASLSACLLALYAASHSGTVERTAQTLLDILPQAIKHSLSLELKVGELVFDLSQLL